jgi:hypothetical protein
MIENDVYESIDLEACFDPIFDPPPDFMKSKEDEVPSFYASDENGVLYFYHGNTRIRVTEHFAGSGKSAAALIEDVIHYSAKQKISPAC